MAQGLSMADLLAKQEVKKFSIQRGQEVEGEIIASLDSDFILDLGTKAEGILPKKDFSDSELEKIKVGDKIKAFVNQSENESGQVVLGMQRALSGKAGANAQLFRKFENARKDGTTLSGKVLELNKGGLIVEVSGFRGFLPTSQVGLSQANALDEMIGKDVSVMVIEVDPAQNRLIFSQKTQVSEETIQKLNSLKVGDKVAAKIGAVLPFGLFVSFGEGLEGLVHISEISWEKVADAGTLFKVGEEVEAKIVSIDASSGRANLSIKQLSTDPFTKIAEDFQADDVVRGTITKVDANGVSLSLKDGVEGLISASKMDADTNYVVGEAISCLVDSVDTQKRRVNLVPFVTSTKDLIYK